MYFSQKFLALALQVSDSQILGDSTMSQLPVGFITKAGQGAFQPSILEVLGLVILVCLSSTTCHLSDEKNPDNVVAAAKANNIRLIVALWLLSGFY